MTAPDRRTDDSFVASSSTRSNETSMSNMSFEENSWNDFSNSKDVTPQKPTRGKTRRRSSMIETTSNHGFRSSAADGFNDFFGSDVFGTDVMATDPWCDFSGEFNSDFNKSSSDNRESTTRTMDMTDSSDNDEMFEASFHCDFTDGTMPLRDHNKKKTEKSRAPRGRQGRSTSAGQQEQQQQQQQHRGNSSGRSPSVGRMVPKVLTNEEVAAKRRNRDRSKSSGRSYRGSKPSFVATNTRSRSLPGSRRGRSLSVPRDASNPPNKRSDSKQRLSRSNHSNHTQKSDQNQGLRSRIAAIERRSRSGESSSSSSSSYGSDKGTPMNELRDEGRNRKTRAEDKTRKTQGVKSPKVLGAKSSKSSKEKSKKGPKDKSSKVKRARSKSPKKDKSKSPRERSLKGSRDKSSKGSKDKSLKGSKDKSVKGSKDKSVKGSKDKILKGTTDKSLKGTKEKSSKAPQARSKSPNETRARSKSPKETRKRSKSPKELRARSKSPKETRKRSQSPKELRARSKSPKEMRKRSQSPKELRARSKSPKETRKRSQSPKEPRARSNSPKDLRARSKSPKSSPRNRSKSPKELKSRSKSPRGKSPRTVRDGSRKTSGTSKLPPKKSSNKKNDKDSSKNKSIKLLVSPLPQKSYLSRGTQKRCVSGVSENIDKRRVDIKESLSNLLSDDDGSSHFRKCAERIMGCDHSASTKEQSNCKSYRRHSLLGTSWELSEHSQQSRPKSAESLFGDKNRRDKNRAGKQMRRNSSYGT